MSVLPIEEVLPALRSALRERAAAVLQAPPGAGKTTRVPLALLEEPWLRGQRIFMLEPRRLATRAAAQRMAGTLGERVGETVGYRIRMDTRVGPKTRVEVATEGVLTRMLQTDAALDGIGLVIFDEFHERSLHADLGLALCLQCQAVLRPDLRILAMSATLDGEAVARLLGDAPVLTSHGRIFPVETRYLPHPRVGFVEAAVVRAVHQALVADEGDVLAFLPGAAEIHRTAEQLSATLTDPRVVVAPLYGSMPQREQDRAIAPSPPGHRKVVLATSIAETSLTIEGVRVVIDSGTMRVPRFSPRTGMTRLETVPVSRAAADQRRGRAGRLGPGVCYRLWTEREQAALLPHRPPEILEADLAPLALELAVWGVTDPAELAWLDPPPAGAFAQACELLATLGALDVAGAVTAHGRRMAGAGMHPRLAHMLLRAADLDAVPLACDLAALLEERDVLRGDGRTPDADLRPRVALLRDARRGRTPATVQGHAVDRGAVQRVLTTARHWRERNGAGNDTGDPDAAGLLLAFAYPDRIGQQRRGTDLRYLLRNGRGATLTHPQALSDAGYIVAAAVDGQGRDSRIFLAAPVEEAALHARFAQSITAETAVEWDAGASAVRARRRERLGALVLREAAVPEPDAEAVAHALLNGVAAAGMAALPWSKYTRQLQQRLLFLHSRDATWPDVSDAALAATLTEWLLPYIYGMRSLADLQRLDLGELLLTPLPWKQRQQLDAWAPTHVEVPSGSRIPIDYSDPAAPVLSVRLQEVFGWRETPRIAGGAVPLTLHLLSPARRPVQVTQDLASFWGGTYFDVKKDLKGRYPKHYWPDDPLRATATRRTRPAG